MMCLSVILYNLISPDWLTLALFPFSHSPLIKSHTVPGSRIIRTYKCVITCISNIALSVHTECVLPGFMYGSNISNSQIAFKHIVLKRKGTLTHSTSHLLLICLMCNGLHFIFNSFTACIICVFIVHLHCEHTTCIKSILFELDSYILYI